MNDSVTRQAVVYQLQYDLHRYIMSLGTFYLSYEYTLEFILLFSKGDSYRALQYSGEAKHTVTGLSIYAFSPLYSVV